MHTQHPEISFLTEPQTDVLSRSEMYNHIERLIEKNVCFDTIIISLSNLSHICQDVGYKASAKITAEVHDFVMRLTRKYFEPHRFLLFNYNSDEIGLVITIDESANLTSYSLLSELDNGYHSVDFSSSNKGLKVNFRFGMAQNRNGSLCLDKSIGFADEMLRHKNKAASESRVVPGGAYFFNREEIFKALKEDEFELWFQPKVRLSDQTIFGAEALLRWRHPKFGILPPAEFLGWAYYFGLAVEVDNWVIKRAFSQARDWMDKGLRLQLAINVDGESLNQVSFIRSVHELLEQAKIPSSIIEFEITETRTINSGDNVMTVIGILKKMGFSIAIDDFGTGTSNINYLLFLPVDIIKMDKVFIDNIETKHVNHVLCESTINMAHANNCSVVAEGIESEEQSRLLQQLGCEYGQGYFFGEPSLELPNNLPVIKLLDLELVTGA